MMIRNDCFLVRVRLEVKKEDRKKKVRANEAIVNASRTKNAFFESKIPDLKRSSIRAASVRVPATILFIRCANARAIRSCNSYTATKQGIGSSFFHEIGTSVWQGSKTIGKASVFVVLRAFKRFHGKSLARLGRRCFLIERRCPMESDPWVAWNSRNARTCEISG